MVTLKSQIEGGCYQWSPFIQGEVKSLKEVTLSTILNFRIMLIEQSFKPSRHTLVHSVGRTLEIRYSVVNFGSVHNRPSTDPGGKSCLGYTRTLPPCRSIVVYYTTHWKIGSLEGSLIGSSEPVSCWDSPDTGQSDHSLPGGTSLLVVISRYTAHYLPLP